MAKNNGERGIMVFFLNELTNFGPDEVGVKCGFLLAGDKGQNGWQRVIAKDEDNMHTVAEVRSASIFTVEHVMELINANMHIFEGRDLSFKGILFDQKTNVDLALLLSGEALSRLLQSEVLIED